MAVPGWVWDRPTHGAAASARDERTPLKKRNRTAAPTTTPAPSIPAQKKQQRGDQTRPPPAHCHLLLMSNTRQPLIGLWRYLNVGSFGF